MRTERYSLLSVMNKKCYSVRLQSLVSISDRAYVATAFDGSSDIIPKSQVFGPDLEVGKSDAYWISAWILEKKSLQYSHKKVGFFDEHGNRTDDVVVTHHQPQKMSPINNIINQLKK